MGMMVAQFKAAQYNYEINDPMDLLLAGMDRSGAWGILPDFNNSLGLLSRGTLAPGQLVFGGHNRFKYTERDATDVIMGPTRGTLRQAAKVGGAAMKLIRGEPDQIMETEIRAAARLSTPYTLFYFTNMIDKGVREAAKSGARSRREKRNARKEREKKLSSMENAALLKRGDYLFAEMAFEDGGVDEMFGFLRERFEVVSEGDFPIDFETQKRLQNRFRPELLAHLKRASDQDGIDGMLGYLQGLGEEIA
jgi:hypothetical protein